MINQSRAGKSESAKNQETVARRAAPMESPRSRRLAEIEARRQQRAVAQEPSTALVLRPSEVTSPEVRRKRYHELKVRVRRWLAGRFDAVADLKEIHDDKLYKDEYDTFEDFCLEEYGVSRANAYRLLSAADVVQEMSQSETKLNTSQAVELSKIPKRKRAAALRKVKTVGPVTAKAIRAVARGEVIDVEPEPSPNGRERKHTDCPTCRCGESS